MVDITNFEMGQGETFKILLHIYSEPSESVLLDITDYDFRGQLRENYTTEELAAEFAITKLVPYESGSIQVELTSEQTILLNQRKYVYDLYMDSGSNPPMSRRLLEGEFIIRPVVTR